jgi:hypothetical protein
MSKVLISIVIGLGLSTIETSFFSSFYGFFALTPFVFLVSVYLLQHHGISLAVFWLVVHGLMLDITQMGSVPFLTLAYGFTAIVAYVSSKRVFSNRSFYGVMACTITSFTALVFAQVMIGWAGSVGASSFSENFLWSDIKKQAILVFIFMTILFSFAKYIRLFLEKMMLIPKARRTY